MGSDLDLALLLGAAVVLVGVLAVRVSARLGLPGLLLYLGLGLLLGEAGVGIRFDDAALARDLGLVALVVILAEGGLTTRLSTIRPVLGLSVVLATLGVAVSVAVVAVTVHLVLGMDDISMPMDGYVIPCEEHVTRLITFVRGWDRAAPMVVHCYAGISRSTASAFAAVCALNPHRDEISIARQIRAASPIASYFQRMTVIGGVVSSAKSESPQPIMEISSGILSFSVETARRIPVSIEIPPATTAVGRFLLPSRPDTAS